MIDAAFLSRLEDIHQRLVENDGVLTVWMKDLKELHGTQRLKGLVRESIERHLAHRAIGFVGDELPNSENASVRPFLRDSRAARIIEAVQLKGAVDDQQLREFSKTSWPTTTAELITRMKGLLAEYELE